MKKLKILFGIISILCIIVFFEAFSKSIIIRILQYAKVVNYYAGYIYFGLYIIPILLIILNIKSLKQQEPLGIGILLALSGFLMSVFISVSKADAVGGFIVKYHPYIYILPMFIISISLKAFNKRFVIIGVLITLLCIFLLVRYFGYPHHASIDVSSHYTQLVILYVIIFTLQIVYTVKLNYGKRSAN